MTEFKIAANLDEVIALMSDGYRPVAGGTDLVVGARHGKSPLPEKIVSIERVGELAKLEETPDGLLVGAVVTHARLMASQLVTDGYTALADASALVGSPSTRNVGTIGGNVMNASPATDTGAPLTVLGAEVRLRSARGQRRVAVAEFWTGPGATVAEPDELCTAVMIPYGASDSGSAYVRLEYRRAMEIAVVGAAARVDLDPDGSGRIASAAVALTAVAPTIISVDRAREILSGRQLDDSALAAVAAAASEQATPISDLRATDVYRRHCVGVMARRAVQAAYDRARGGEVAVPVNRSTGIGAVR